MKSLLAIAAVCALALPVSELERDAEGFNPLFDGTSLNGWGPAGGKSEFKVQEGEIVGTAVPKSESSYLRTSETYEDFELELEVLVDDKLNSGIQIRSQIEVKDGNPVGMRGYQVEIDPSSRAWTGGIYEEGGRGWLVKLEDNEAARNAFKPGDWNKMRIVCRGPLIQTWINGVAAAEFKDPKPVKGYIGLQIHSTLESMQTIRFRKLRIKTPVAAPPDSDASNEKQATTAG